MTLDYRIYRITMQGTHVSKTMLTENQNFSEQIRQHYKTRATFWKWQQLFSLEARRDLDKYT